MQNAVTPTMFNVLGRLVPWTFRRHLIVMSPQTQNVIQLGLAFFCIFFAFNTASFIEEVVIEEMAKKGVVSTHAGYTSLAIIYAVFTISNFLAASVVHKLGVKIAMALSALTYAAFQAGFLVLHETVLYTTSATLGLGAAIIWTSQGKYLALNSTDETAEKHSGIFWAISQACLACGGVFLSFVFNSETDSLSDTKMKILYGVFTCVTMLGVVLVVFLRSPKVDFESDHTPALSSTQEHSAPDLSTLDLIKSVMSLSQQTQMRLMILVFMYTGVALSFWASIYPTCIGFTTLLGPNTKKLIAWNAIAQGIGQTCGGFLFGILGSKGFAVRRTHAVLLAVVVNLVSYIAVFFFFPSEASVRKTGSSGILAPTQVVCLICGLLLGFGDAVWNTQVFAFLISQYKAQSAQAFSLFKFFQSLIACVVFFSGAKASLNVLVPVMVVGSVLSGVAFVLADRIVSKTGIDNSAVVD